MVKSWPFEFFVQFHENALFLGTIYQFHKYQTLFLVNYIVFSQITDIVFAKFGLILTVCFKIWSQKDLVYNKRAVENAIFFIIPIFGVFDFQI